MTTHTAAPGGVQGVYEESHGVVADGGQGRQLHCGAMVKRCNGEMAKGCKVVKGCNGVTAIEGWVVAAPMSPTTSPLESAPSAILSLTL